MLQVNRSVWTLGKWILEPLRILLLTLQAPNPKMVIHTETIRQQKPTNFLIVFDHFVELVFKGLG